MDCNDGGDIRGDRQQGQHQRLIQAGRKQPSLEGQNPGQNPGGDQSSGFILKAKPHQAAADGHKSGKLDGLQQKMRRVWQGYSSFCCHTPLCAAIQLAWNTARAAALRRMHRERVFSISILWNGRNCNPANWLVRILLGADSFLR